MSRIHGLFFTPLAALAPRRASAIFDTATLKTCISGGPSPCGNLVTNHVGHWKKTKEKVGAKSPRCDTIRNGTQNDSGSHTLHLRYT